MSVSIQYAYTLRMLNKNGRDYGEEYGEDFGEEYGRGGGFAAYWET